MGSESSVMFCDNVLLFVLFFFCVFHCSFFLYCIVSVCDVRAATLTEVFPCFFLSCITRKNGARPTLPKLLLNVLNVMYVPFSVSCGLFVCKCVL
jgi:hypothetical protein